MINPNSILTAAHESTHEDRQDVPRAYEKLVAPRGEVFIHVLADQSPGFAIGGIREMAVAKIDTSLGLSEERQSRVSSKIVDLLITKFGEAPFSKMVKLEDNMPLPKLITALGKLRSMIAECLNRFEEADQMPLAKLLIETPWGTENTPEASPALQKSIGQLILQSLNGVSVEIKTSIERYLNEKNISA